MMQSSFVFAAELPDNYIVIGNKVVELSFAMQNKELFNEILTEHILNAGLEGLYLGLGGALANVYGAPVSQTEQIEVLSQLNELIDTDSPSGEEFEPEVPSFAKANVTIETLAFGTSTVFTVTVNTIEGLDGGVKASLNDGAAKNLGESMSVSVITGENVTLNIMDADGNIIATGTITGETTGEVALTAVSDPGNEDEDFEVIDIQ